MLHAKKRAIAGALCYGWGMRKLWPLWLLIGCSSGWLPMLTLLLVLWFGSDIRRNSRIIIYGID